MAHMFSASCPVQGSCWHRPSGTLATKAREQTLQVLMSACDGLPSSRRRRQTSSRMRTGSSSSRKNSAHRTLVHLAPYMCIALRPATIDRQAKSK